MRGKKTLGGRAAKWPQEEFSEVPDCQNLVQRTTFYWCHIHFLVSIFLSLFLLISLRKSKSLLWSPQLRNWGLIFCQSLWSFLALTPAGACFHFCLSPAFSKGRHSGWLVFGRTDWTKKFLEKKSLLSLGFELYLTSYKAPKGFGEGCLPHW